MKNKYSIEEAVSVMFLLGLNVELDSFASNWPREGVALNRVISTLGELYCSSSVNRTLSIECRNLAMAIYYNSSQLETLGLEPRQWINYYHRLADDYELASVIDFDETNETNCDAEDTHFIFDGGKKHMISYHRIGNA